MGTVEFLCYTGGVTDGQRVGRAAPHSSPEHASARSSLGGPPGAGGHLIPPWRVGPNPSPSGAEHCPLRLPTAPLPGLSLRRRRPRGSFPILCSLDPVVAWLSGPSPSEEPRGSHLGPGAVSSL